MIPDLKEEIKKHLRDEISDIAKYNLLAGRLPKEHAEKVIRIAQDESRHMAYLSRMATLLFGWQEIYPYRATVRIDAERIRTILKESILEERKTAEEYAYLLIELRARGTSYTVIESMLEKMIRDERRHAKILEGISNSIR